MGALFFFFELLVPVVRVTSVRPMFRVSNVIGARISYQSFFENGSALKRCVFFDKFSFLETKSTYTFFFPPFFPPLVIRLLLPMAIFQKRSENEKTSFDENFLEL